MARVIVMPSADQLEDGVEGPYIMLEHVTLTQRQLERLERLPDDHKVVSARDGAPVIRRPDGELLKVHRSGRMAPTTPLPTAQSYLAIPPG